MKMKKKHNNEERNPPKKKDKLNTALDSTVSFCMGRVSRPPRRRGLGRLCAGQSQGGRLLAGWLGLVSGLDMAMAVDMDIDMDIEMETDVNDMDFGW